jgi:hypothetical protein
MAMLLRVLTILAVLVMPFGMVTPAAAAHHQSAASAMPLQHCPDEQQRSDAPGIAQCTMACAAALPAPGSFGTGGPKIVCAPEPPAPPHALHGIQEDIATPPPKRS